MGSRVLFLALAVALFSSMAFAGPQIVISDPLCTHAPGEIDLGSGAFSFTFNGQSSLTFCNTTAQTFTSLNFTITMPTAVNLGGFYCGAPDSGAAAFDYCMVLDPNKPNQGNGGLFGHNFGVNPQELVVHQFVTTYATLFPPAIKHDTPTSFYQNGTCFFGCTPGTTVGTDPSNILNLSFDIVNPLGLRPELCSNSIATPVIPCGLLPNHEFTLTLACDPKNTIDGGHPAIPCTSLPDGSGVSLEGFNNPNQVTFPTAVPEPTSLALLATAGIPALLRRRRKKS
jgi:hypothetical protein